MNSRVNSQFKKSVLSSEFVQRQFVKLSWRFSVERRAEHGQAAPETKVTPTNK